MPRGSVGAAVYAGAIYAVGGLNAGQVTSSVERYDPVEDLWTRIPDMTVPRRRLAVVATDASLGEETAGLYVFGGDNGNEVLASAERYDLTNGWQALPATVFARRTQAAFVFLA